MNSFFPYNLPTPNFFSYIESSHLPLLWGHSGGGSPWLQTVNCNSLLISNKMEISSLLEKYLSVYLFQVNNLVTFTLFRHTKCNSILCKSIKLISFIRNMLLVCYNNPLLDKQCVFILSAYISH